jgi:uncharacterized protein YjcR
MGRTTNAHIEKIGTLSSACGQPVTSFSEALIAAKRLHAQMNALAQVMTNRHKAVFGNGTDQTTDKEKAIARDPQFVQAEAQIHALNTEFEKVCGDRLIPARDTLQQANNALDKAIKEFDAFVTAKEKSWFGSKQSVPAARKAIGDGRKYLTTVGNLLKLSV